MNNAMIPAIHRAAAVAKAINPDNPQAAVTKELATDAGLPLRGWIGSGRTWWREHSTQAWGAVVVLDTTLQLLQQDIPAEWTRVGHWVAVAAGVTGIILKYRVQAGLVLERIRAATRRQS